MAEVSLYEQDVLRAASQDLPWQLLDGKNVLVTGATGLIGGAVADVLMAANPQEIDTFIFNAGVELNTPALEEERDGLLPPWKYEASYD